MMMASVAQQAARESHNLEVVSSNLTRGRKYIVNNTWDNW